MVNTLRVMGHLRRDESTAPLVDSDDRLYVESLAPGVEREKVISSLARYRAPEVLQAGDALPEVTVRRAVDLEPIGLAQLVQGRPLLLVFGSFT
jgi:hypothetical protein